MLAPLQPGIVTPLEDEKPLNEITYKSRLNQRMLEPHLRGVKADDGDGRVLAYLAALTSQPKGILKALDTADKRICNAIVLFFIS